MSKRQPLGPVLSFLLPSLKLKQRNEDGTTVEERLHRALLDHFGGYTAASGNIFGFWRKGKRDVYGEHREYRVALLEDQADDQLEEYLAKLAAEIDEEEIYCERQGEAFTIAQND